MDQRIGPFPIVRPFAIPPIVLGMYSPLAGGRSTGKYHNQDKAVLQSSGSRLTLFPGSMDRYFGRMNEAVVNAYCDCAAKHNMTPS